MGSSDAFDFCDEPLPFSPGQSPFHIKGEFYRGTMRAFAKYAARGDDVIATLSPELQAFLNQPFLASSWYDVLPYPCIGTAEAQHRCRTPRGALAFIEWCYIVAKPT